MQFSKVRVCMIMDVLIFGIAETYENLQFLSPKLTLSSLIIPANVTKLTMKLLNAWTTLRFLLHVAVTTLKMAGDAECKPVIASKPRLV